MPTTRSGRVLGPEQSSNSGYVSYQQDYRKPKRRKTTILDPTKDNTRLARAREQASKTAPKVIKTIHETAQPMPNCMLNIDNASFLEVWTSVVTQFLHPDLSWTTCLSVGNAIVTICTASDEYHHDPAQDNDHPSKGAAKNELEVMGFRLRLKCRLAVVDNQNRPADGAALESKFDSKDDYKTLKESLESSLQISHGGCESILAEDAWTFYNELRPTVSQGPESWYKKSEQTMEEREDAARAFASLPNMPAKRQRR
ncbi:hypothetical protein D6C92_05167 [Aureobasidium pullulans]|nr:hypothetical protein D6C92_05167 [Aureobasidium pullulans]TIA23338.1 hypothetical protein D6C81_02944 [Aureobasidium pullulans]